MSYRSTSRTREESHGRGGRSRNRWCVTHQCQILFSFSAFLDVVKEAQNRDEVVPRSQQNELIKDICAACIWSKHVTESPGSYIARGILGCRKENSGQTWGGFSNSVYQVAGKEYREWGGKQYVAWVWTGSWNLGERVPRELGICFEAGSSNDWRAKIA